MIRSLIRIDTDLEPDPELFPDPFPFNIFSSVLCLINFIILENTNLLINWFYSFFVTSVNLTFLSLTGF
jgi:hypothetical protein